jgi:hypothetical protein
MTLGRLVSILGFVLALGAAIFSIVHLFSTRARDHRFAEARPCTPEQLARLDWRSCWVEQPATIADKGRNGYTDLATRWNNRPITVTVALDELAADTLAVGDPVTARLMDAKVMLVRTSGAELEPADSFARTSTDQLLALAAFAGVALLLGVHLVTHRAAPRATRLDAVGLLLCVVGVPATILLPILGLRRGSEAKSYAQAPPCAGAEQPDCRFWATGTVVDMQCAHSGSFNDTHCELTYAIDGAPQPERRVCSLQREPANKAQAARVGRLELWNGWCTRLEIGGQTVSLLSSPRSASSSLAGAGAAAFWLAAIGVYRLIRRARRAPAGAAPRAP